VGGGEHLGQRHILSLIDLSGHYLLTVQLFTSLNRTQGLVSSAEALGVATETEGKSTDKPKHSPVVDRAALYRYCLHLWKNNGESSPGFSGRSNHY